MKIRIGEHDLAIFNRGKNRNDKQFLVIVDDKDENFVSGSSGAGTTPLGKLYMQNLMDTEADKHGAQAVVKGSTCRVGGNLSMYIDDSVGLYNKGDFVTFMDPDLGDFLIAEGLATAGTGW